MSPRARLRLVAAAAAYLLAIGLALRLLASVVKAPVAQWTLGALLVSVVAMRAGLQAEPFNAVTGARALRGAGLASAAVAVCLLAMLLEGASLVWAPGAPSSSLFYSTLVAAALAYRDELWLRGIPLHFARRAELPQWLTGCYLIATGVAAIALETHSSTAGVVLTACSGAFFTALWLKSGDLWAPVAARFAWGWLSEALLAGELLDLTNGWLPHGPAARGIGAWVASATFLLAAGLVWKFWPAAQTPTAEASPNPL